MRIRYRVWQFVELIAARPFSESAANSVAAVLTPAERSLFNRYREGDKWHGYRVMSALRQAGYDDPEILAAALLHDVGKTKYKVSVLDRVLIVLGRLLPKKLTDEWGDAQPRGWKRPFVVKKQHPQWSAEMAEAAGSAPRTIWFMARHQDPVPENATSTDDDLLRFFQQVDDNN